jgi:hypothetical protein
MGAFSSCRFNGEEKGWRRAKKEILNQNYRPSFFKLAWKHAKVEVLNTAVVLPLSMWFAYDFFVLRASSDLLSGFAFLFSLLTIGANGISAKIRVDPARPGMIKPKREQVPRIY